MSEEKSFFSSCLYFASGSFNRNISRMAEEAFAKTGLAPSYAFVLMTVNRFESGVMPSVIAREMHLTPSTITRLMDKLEQKGLIVREQEGKTTLVRPTASSINLQDELMAAWMDLYKKYTAIFGKDQANQLAMQLYRASEKLKE